MPKWSARRRSRGWSRSTEDRRPDRAIFGERPDIFLTSLLARALTNMDRALCGFAVLAALRHVVAERREVAFFDRDPDKVAAVKTALAGGRTRVIGAAFDMGVDHQA